MRTDRALRINSAARFKCAPDWSWDTEAGFPDYDLWTVLEGRGTLRCGKRVYELSRGATFLLSPRTRYVASHDPTEPISVIAVHFDARPAPDLALHRRIVPTEFLAGVLERLLSAHVRGRDSQAAFWLQAALAEANAGDEVQMQSGRAQIREIAAQIRERPGDQWVSAGLADRVSLSTQHFSRLFKRETGASPGTFVIQARVAAAKAYLRGSSLSIKRIAAILGYHDEFHFSNQFARHTGTRPSTYRRGSDLTPMDSESTDLTDG
jgi:AraC-like DNA-binding protein